MPIVMVAVYVLQTEDVSLWYNLSWFHAEAMWNVQRVVDFDVLVQNCGD